MIEFVSYDAAVIGTGAAGYAAAVKLCEGKKRVVIISEGRECGTSRNTGSDKQTYYKLSLGGGSRDSVRLMAADLFSSGAVDGDNALCEAAGSVSSFDRLCALGVQFPRNRYGEYIGYKTDHDPYARATSAGPLTSKYMTEALEKRANELDIPLIDNARAIKILKHNEHVCGVLCVSTLTGGFFAVKCPDVVVCTGGPAIIYKDSVYPECHGGASSLFLDAGAPLQNMTEWQYGLASVSPRWNVSGTYMQVLPRLYSVDDEGTQHEFLLDFFDDEYAALSMLFYKGYQWPFDSAKVYDGSSVIDLLVYRETKMYRRRVFLDYTENPFGMSEINYDNLCDDAREYLFKAGAAFGRPIDRLVKMNAPAVELYKSKGVDIEKMPLEIALCAQHNNGGAAVDLWWQTPVRGLFAAGECAGTHGITRPGGSALNAGQVGAARAASYIIAHPSDSCGDDEFCALLSHEEDSEEAFLRSIINSVDNTALRLDALQQRMSRYAGAIRVYDDMNAALQLVCDEINHFTDTVKISRREDAVNAYRLLDALKVSRAVLTAFCDYSAKVKLSRGSALYYDKDGARRPGLDECFRLKAEKCMSDKIQYIECSGGEMTALWRDVRPLPEDDDFFENVWAKFRENGGVY